MNRFRAIFIFLLMTAITGGCAHKGGTTSGNPFTEDGSASGAVAQAVGGAMSTSSSTGLQAFYRPSQSSSTLMAKHLLFDLSLWPKAWASAICPTFMSTGAQCTASGSSMTLTYADCSFPNSSVNWHGRQKITMSAGAAACGSFPDPGANGHLYRQFVNAAGNSPGVMYLTTDFGSVAGIDHSTGDLGNFDQQTIATMINGGYGMKVDFDAGNKRVGLTLAERVVVVGAYDHSIIGALTVSETTSSSRTVSGTVTVYLNGMHVVGTSTINLVHDDQCCQPIDGEIDTAFAAGQNVAPTGLGSLLVGHSEKLKFTGCGTAQYQASDGTVTNVRLSRCF